MPKRPAPWPGVRSRSAPAHPVVSVHERILSAARSLFAGKGYENASTVAIARQAGTSESQLMKHFGSKDGLLEAIFDDGWKKTLAVARRAMVPARSPREKLRILIEVTLAAIDRDPELKLLLMLEGRHIRRGAPLVILAPGFLDFVDLLDGVLAEMRAAGQLRRGLHLEAVRSALMGAVEGLLRDQLLARRIGYPARYSAKEARRIFAVILSAFVAPSPRAKQSRRPAR